jgi:hypothetical protein
LYFYNSVFPGDKQSKKNDTYCVLCVSHQKQSIFGQCSLKRYRHAKKTAEKLFACNFGMGLKSLYDFPWHQAEIVKPGVKLGQPF